MKKRSAILVLLAVAAPALAQSAPQATARSEKALYTCWYSDEGKLTGVTPAAAGEIPHYLQLTGRGGDKAWAYAIRSADGHDCPAHRPSQD
jgi:hypothetical protein